MRFDLFNTRSDAHTRKAREYLQQANISRLDHQVAAEHHAALASMYAQRVAWLEAELSAPMADFGTPLRGVVPKLVDGTKRGSESVINLSRTPRSGSIDSA